MNTIRFALRISYLVVCIFINERNRPECYYHSSQGPFFFPRGIYRPYSEEELVATGNGKTGEIQKLTDTSSFC